VDIDHIVRMDREHNLLARLAHQQRHNRRPLSWTPAGATQAVSYLHQLAPQRPPRYVDPTVRLVAEADRPTQLASGQVLGVHAVVHNIIVARLP
jgi:hypothetical protein